jgi:hypothetical protein
MFRWTMRVCLVAIVLIAALLLLKDTLLKLIVERRVRAVTGLGVNIERLEFGLARPRLTLKNVIISNTLEFGGASLIDFPELFVEFDADAFRERRFRVKLLGVHIRELNIVESRDGRTNVIALRGRFANGAAKSSAGGRSQARVEFSGIDTLTLTVGQVNYSNLRDPNRNGVFEMGLTNEVLRNVKSVDDITAGLLQSMLRKGISLQAGPEGWRLNLFSAFFSAAAGTNATAAPGTSPPFSERSQRP